MCISKPTSHHDDSRSKIVRKRVCRACDRCRLKKSKCDGDNPCSRCRVDNSICVFGKRKTVHKAYPRSYVEKLEQQQIWLVKGLQELYRRVAAGTGWPGDRPSHESGDYPLTHDLLARLGALDQSKDEHFEERLEILQNVSWSHESSEGILKDVQSRVHRQPAHPEASSHKIAPSSLPVIIDQLNQARIQEQSMRAAEKHIIPSTHGFVNPLNGEVSLPQWQPSSEFKLLDEMDWMNTATCSNTIIDGHVSSLIFNHQMQVDCYTRFHAFNIPEQDCLYDSYA
ncbi:hypothetical protein BDV12DRAFT_209008 [Aspergillus spectabilis]